jgi:Natural resistance-associated macrophage protein
MGTIPINEERDCRMRTARDAAQQARSPRPGQPAASAEAAGRPGAVPAGRAGIARFRERRWAAAVLLAVWGPGIIVMLADGDAGCLITAAQSGAQWGYRLILPSLILIPVLYMVQEMTVRLGIGTGKGHGALIRDRFGRSWAMLSAGPMMVSAVGTLVVEFAGVAGVGELFGISRLVTVPVATVFLIALAFTRGYRRVERSGSRSASPSSRSSRRCSSPIPPSAPSPRSSRPSPSASVPTCCCSRPTPAR